MYIYYCSVIYSFNYNTCQDECQVHHFKCDCHLSEIETFRCQEREIEPIDEIIYLLPWGLQTTLSVLIGDQKDNVQFIQPGEGELERGQGGWEVYLIIAWGPILLCKRNPSNLMVLIILASKLIIGKEWVNSNNEHWLVNILLSYNVHIRSRFFLMSTNKEKQYWFSNVNGKLSLIDSLTRLLLRLVPSWCAVYIHLWH